MRKLFFIAFIISTGSLVQAQDVHNSSKSVQLKVNTTSISIINVLEQPTLPNRKATTLVGIFVMKNSRVKRALSFKVKTKKPKLV
ncbi:hypothetical protein [Maribacter antarcticus]|uniref:hypothetical protein n=1 Tax=Maribacter antarcticus TaxID=505250 RepID=UPI00047B6074|nr:hypothetical protein [Maribacter antarcticus]